MAAFIMYGIYYYQGDYRVMEFHKKDRKQGMAWDCEDQADIIFTTVNLERALNFVDECIGGALDPYIHFRKYLDYHLK